MSIERIKILDEKIKKEYDTIQQIDNEVINENETFENFYNRRQPYYDKIGKFDREKRLLMVPKFEPIFSYGDKMTLKEFKIACESGFFIDSDGHGYYIRDNKESNIQIMPSDFEYKSIRPDFDMIIWFNK